VGVGVAVGAGVAVGEGVAVGSSVALGVGVGVGADAGAQADNTRLTSKKTSNMRFIVRILLSAVSAAQRSALQPQADRKEACRLKAQVGRRSFTDVFTSLPEIAIQKPLSRKLQ